MAIRRAVYQVTFLYDTRDGELPAQLNASTVGENLDSGSWLGLSGVVSDEPIKRRDVIQAERELGGDGSRFAR